MTTIADSIGRLLAADEYAARHSIDPAAEKIVGTDHFDTWFRVKGESHIRIAEKLLGALSQASAGTVEAMARIIAPIDWEAFDREGDDAARALGFDTTPSMEKARTILASMTQVISRQSVQEAVDLCERSLNTWIDAAWNRRLAGDARDFRRAAGGRFDALRADLGLAPYPSGDLGDFPDSLANEALPPSPQLILKALKIAGHLSCGQIGDNDYVIKQRLDHTYAFIQDTLKTLKPAAPRDGQNDHPLDVVHQMIEALDEFSREYDGFENGDGHPCPTLEKARRALAAGRWAIWIDDLKATALEQAIEIFENICPDSAPRRRWLASARFALRSMPTRMSEAPHADLATLYERLQAAKEALEPFATFADSHIDEEGWNGPISRTRIVDWFGPSDFRRAHAAHAAAGPAAFDTARALNDVEELLKQDEGVPTGSARRALAERIVAAVTAAGHAPADA